MLSDIFLLLGLIALNAFFAASEIALISLNDNKIRLMAEEGNKKARLIDKLLSDPSRFLATIQIGITLAGFLASAFAADTPSSRMISTTSSPAMAQYAIKRSSCAASDTPPLACSSVETRTYKTALSMKLISLCALVCPYNKLIAPPCQTFCVHIKPSSFV